MVVFFPNIEMGVNQSQDLVNVRAHFSSYFYNTIKCYKDRKENSTREVKLSALEL